MQAELEKLAVKLETESMISASYTVGHGDEEYHHGQCDAYQRAAEIVREWAVEYAGLVLCDAEPVAYFARGTDCFGDHWSYASVFREEVEKTMEDESCATLQPLYAPASLAGNADILPQGEAGKEGGE